MTSRLVLARVAAKTERATGGGGKKRTGILEGTEGDVAHGGRREGKGRANEARGGGGTRDELSLLKVVPGRWDEMRKGDGGRTAGWTT